jgi:hypothetical protein
VDAEVRMRGSTRRSVIVAVAALVGAAGVGFAGDGPAGDDRFVVHEWGTFTSMAGADGVALEGLSREEEPLPAFVYSRSKVRACPLRSKGWKGLEVPADHVTQKMETPVIYFHSAKERRVRVRVDFMRGLLSQWYPVSDLLGPPEGSCDAGPLDISKVERSFLQWDVDVLARGTDAPSDVPAAAKDDPWTYARDVDANWIRTLPRKEPERAGPVESERFLFYRGLGSFPLALSASVERGGKFTLRNAGDAPIAPAIVLQVDGDRGQIAETPAVPAHGEAGVALHGGDWWGPIAEVEDKLKVLVAQKLVAAGLQQDEARAMVRTWSRSWFRCQGTRVLWLVPRTGVDALLPLSVDPKPDDFVRVLVGRMEVITPEIEAEDYAALADIASNDPARTPRGAAVLDRRGRFAEPHVRRAIAAIDARSAKPLAEDAAVRSVAKEWLDTTGGGSGEPFPR